MSTRYWVARRPTSRGSWPRPAARASRPAESRYPEAMEPLLDRLSRPLETLRISITDRCNFRCVYCMPKEVFGRDYAFLERTALLSFEEIARVTRVFAELGVKRVRITGGEPLVRRNVEQLIAQLHEIPTPQGHPLELAITTNGALLAQ